MKTIDKVIILLLSTLLVLNIAKMDAFSNNNHTKEHGLESTSDNNCKHEKEHNISKTKKLSSEKNIGDTSVKFSVSNNGSSSGHSEDTVTTIAEVSVSNNETSTSNSANSVSTNGISENTGYIFVGDSRFVGMDIYCNIDEQQDKFLIAKVGEGYSYLITYAIPQISEIINSNTSFEHWKVIIGLGVNDLGNINKYVEAYNEINNEQFELVLVSVNPVEYHSYITNETIESFNNNLKAIENTKYIDTYQCLIDNGYSTSDGVHYTKSTYETIYSIIVNNM